MIQHIGTNKRKVKRFVKKFVKQANELGYFIDCRYHVCKMNSCGFHSQDLYGAEIDGISLINSTSYSCSIMHCSPELITKQRAESLAALFREKGWNEYVCNALQIPEENQEKFIEDYSKMNKAWNNFRQKSGIIKNKFI